MVCYICPFLSLHFNKNKWKKKILQISGERVGTSGGGYGGGYKGYGGGYERYGGGYGCDEFAEPPGKVCVYIL